MVPSASPPLCRIVVEVCSESLLSSQASLQLWWMLAADQASAPSFLFGFGGSLQQKPAAHPTDLAALVEACSGSGLYAELHIFRKVH